ncbi:hypothetical protein [Curtobacterium sp. MCSS17_015]|uniref:hypothetical protein n=1 Tax=Curtobacterium sp. MCSS17_015 TaxID=2175666 RepID=UPI000DA77008|nr:hypothetical protein [Curtobacterium sp. MCSS17_015]WIB27744.1 hypothetical protein DEJ18_06555 [Curtobacterium sp. MCSS17_015]
MGSTLHRSGTRGAGARRTGGAAAVDPVAARGLSTTEAALVDAIADRVRRGRADAALTDTADVDALAERMLAALPTVKHEADALVGPFYDTASLATWRGVTRQAIHKASQKRDLLGLKIGDGSRIFPSFQFGGSGTPLPHLREVLDLLDRDGIDPWGSALWLNTVADEFGGTTAAQALRDGRVEPVLAAARRAANAWHADA